MSAQPQLPTTTDVLIVGAGPVGLTLAAALATKGVAVVLVDQQAEGANTSRACVVHARTMEVLDDLGVTPELLDRGRIVPRFTVRDRDRALLTIDFDGLPTDHPYTLMIPQNVTEEILLNRLRHNGGRVFRPYRVVDVAQDGDGVVTTMATGETVRARYVVGADGMHSTVRAFTGVGFSGGTYGESFVLADVRMDWPLSAEEVVLYFSPAGMAVVAALPGENRFRIVATVAEAPEQPDLAFMQALLDARGPRRSPARIQEIIWSSRFRVHHRLAEHYRAGRLLLAGDAAHVHSPAGGQGMNTGIQDAVSLAGYLTNVLRNGAHESTLDGYETERRPVAAGVVVMADRMTRLANIGFRPLRRARNVVLRGLDFIPAVHRVLAMNLSELTSAGNRVA